MSHTLDDMVLGEVIRWLQSRMAQLADQRVDRQDRFPPIPADSSLGRIQQLFGLSGFELQVLSVCAATELSPSLRQICLERFKIPAPTFSLAMSMLDEPSWDAVVPTRPLLRWRLIHAERVAGRSIVGCPIQIDDRILNFLKGIDHTDERLLSFVELLPAANDENLSESQQVVCMEIVNRISSCLDGPESFDHPLNAGESHAVRKTEIAQKRIQIDLLTSSGAAAAEFASFIATTLGMRVLRLRNEQSVDALEATLLARLLDRECRLSNVVLFADLTEETNPVANGTQSILAMTECLALIAASEPRRKMTLSFDIQRPSPVEQSRKWKECLQFEMPSHAEQIASQFSLSFDQIETVSSRLHSRHVDVNQFGQLWSLCRQHSRPRLNQLAQRIDTKATWTDLVLPHEEMLSLRQIANHVRQRACVLNDWGFRDRLNRGYGTSVLFAGESGTGKTMAAEVLATDLQLDLYRIDLSTVTSKYIGETEKNLRRLFDAADEGGVILFFDEADALFGKRSQVRDSHDRYANLQVDYLLQRLETYRGLAILATNIRSSLDSAFLRRLRAVITFPFPEPPQRRAIWANVFPPSAPSDNLDYDRLAKLHLSGGSIHNVALNAAYSAAAEGPSISMTHVLAAAKSEYQKMQKPVNQADFRPLEKEIMA